MGDDAQQRAVRVCLTRCPLPPADESVHSLPCHIHHDGVAAIKSYFRPEQDEQSDKATWRAEFRGVQLRGTRVSLKDMGMQGLVLEDAGMTHEDDEGRIWEVDNHFDELTVWDVPNGGGDGANLPATLTEWTALAHAVRGTCPNLKRKCVSHVGAESRVSTEPWKRDETSVCGHSSPTQVASASCRLISWVFFEQIHDE